MSPRTTASSWHDVRPRSSCAFVARHLSADTRRRRLDRSRRSSIHLLAIPDSSWRPHEVRRCRAIAARFLLLTLLIALIGEPLQMLTDVIVVDGPDPVRRAASVPYIIFAIAVVADRPAAAGGALHHALAPAHAPPRRRPRCSIYLPFLSFDPAVGRTPSAAIGRTVSTAPPSPPAAPPAPGVAIADDSLAICRLRRAGGSRRWVNHLATVVIPAQAGMPSRRCLAQMKCVSL